MLTTGQRQEVRERLTQLEAEAGVLFMRAENLRVHLDTELLVPVYQKVAELVEVLQQLRCCVEMSSDGPNGALERLQELRRLKEGSRDATGTGRHGD